MPIWQQWSKIMLSLGSYSLLDLKLDYLLSF